MFKASDGYICSPGRIWLGFGKCPLKDILFKVLPSGQKKSLWVWSKSIRVKGGPASYLLQVKIKLGLSQVGSGPISS